MACAPLSIVYFFSAPLKGWVGRGATLSYEAARRGASGRAAILRFGFLGRPRRVGKAIDNKGRINAVRGIRDTLSIRI